MEGDDSQPTFVHSISQFLFHLLRDPLSRVPLTQLRVMSIGTQLLSYQVQLLTNQAIDHDYISILPSSFFPSMTWIYLNQQVQLWNLTQLQSYSNTSAGPPTPLFSASLNATTHMCDDSQLLWLDENFLSVVLFCNQGGPQTPQVWIQSYTPHEDILPLNEISASSLRPRVDFYWDSGPWTWEILCMQQDCLGIARTSLNTFQFATMGNGSYNFQYISELLFDTSIGTAAVTRIASLLPLDPTQFNYTTFQPSEDGESVYVTTDPILKLLRIDLSTGDIHDLWQPDVPTGQYSLSHMTTYDRELIDAGCDSLGQLGTVIVGSWNTTYWTNFTIHLLNYSAQGTPHVLLESWSNSTLSYSYVDFPRRLSNLRGLPTSVFTLLPWNGSAYPDIFVVSLIGLDECDPVLNVERVSIPQAGTNQFAWNDATREGAQINGDINDDVFMQWWWQEEISADSCD